MIAPSMPITDTSRPITSNPKPIEMGNSNVAFTGIYRANGKVKAGIQEHWRLLPDKSHNIVTATYRDLPHMHIDGLRLAVTQDGDIITTG